MKIACIGVTDSQHIAGLDADLRTLEVLGSSSPPSKGASTPSSPITSLVVKCGSTTQSPRGKVLAISPLEPVAVKRQLARLDATIQGVKIGALLTPANVEAVARKLPTLKCPKVLDPVLEATAGGKLLDPQGTGLLLTELLPRVDVITPNLREGKLLSGQTEPAAIADALLAKGAKTVLLKGGHIKPFRGDLLATPSHRAWVSGGGINAGGSVGGVSAGELSGGKLKGSARATGCVLATGLAFYLATQAVEGLTPAVLSPQVVLTQSVRKAQALVRRGIATAKGGVIWAHINCRHSL